MIVYEVHYHRPGMNESRVAYYSADDGMIVRDWLAADGAQMLALYTHEVRHIDDPNLRYPADRPSWLGTGQPWPCGRCGSSVDADGPHRCVVAAVAP